VATLAAAGGLAGLAGGVEVMGLEHNLPATFSSGYGYDAIAVAFLARSNPYGVFPAAFLWGGLRSGAGLMQIRAGISIDLVNVIQALVIVFIAADPVIRKLYGIRRNPKRRAVFSKAWGE
jgi:simple sugar transport system permease protein